MPVPPARSLPAATRRRAPAASPRERIDETAYELFSSRGVRAVGIDELVARSGVAKMTLYRHYPSKEALAIAFLRRREALWTRDWLQAEVERRAQVPAERLLAIFDIFDAWFRRADFEGCSFINVLLETDGKDHPVRRAAAQHLATIRVFLAGLAEQAGVADAQAFAHQWHILMKGSIVAAGEGDRKAALRARAMGRLLLTASGIETADAPPAKKPARGAAARAHSVGRKPSIER